MIFQFPLHQYGDVHREKGGTLGMVPLIINNIYTLYRYLLGVIGYIMVYPLLKASLRG